MAGSGAGDDALPVRLLRNFGHSPGPAGTSTDDSPASPIDFNRERCSALPEQPRFRTGLGYSQATSLRSRCQAEPSVTRMAFFSCL